VQELSKRLGLAKEMEGSPREWLKRIFKPMEKLGLSVERVMESPVRCPIAPMVAFEDRRFLTPSGKFEFIDHFYEEKRNAFPYYLLSPLSRMWHLSLILEDEHPEIPQVFIHPELAKEKGILNKAMVLLKSKSGELVAEAVLSEAIREDTISITHGTWIKKGGGVNQLTEDLASTAGNMASYYSSTVSIQAI
jgi:anaerobic selenocysteine-containing dehydrogenase